MVFINIPVNRKSPLSESRLTEIHCIYNWLYSLSQLLLELVAVSELCRCVLRHRWFNALLSRETSTLEAINVPIRVSCLSQPLLNLEVDGFFKTISFPNWVLVVSTTSEEPRTRNSVSLRSAFDRHFLSFFVFFYSLSLSTTPLWPSTSVDLISFFPLPVRCRSCCRRFQPEMSTKTFVFI